MFIIFNTKSVVMYRTFYHKISIDHKDINCICQHNEDGIEITLTDGVVFSTDSYSIETLTKKLNNIEKLNMNTED